MADGRTSFNTTRFGGVYIDECFLVNDARAMRIAELINDYRTLQLHISQQLSSVATGDVQQEGFRILAQSSTAAQRLLAAGFASMPIEDQGSNPEMEKAQLRQYVYANGCENIDNGKC
jgi:hypothetical protein